MSADDLIMAFDEINEQYIQDSCGDPFYALKYAPEALTFQTEINESIDHSLERLMSLPRWGEIQESIIQYSWKDILAKKIRQEVPDTQTCE